jgi:hypothetical protein
VPWRSKTVFWSAENALPASPNSPGGDDRCRLEVVGSPSGIAPPRHVRPPSVDDQTAHRVNPPGPSPM